jgi:hypothetical protein
MQLAVTAFPEQINILGSQQSSAGLTIHDANAIVARHALMAII